MFKKRSVTFERASVKLISNRLISTTRTGVKKKFWTLSIALKIKLPANFLLIFSLQPGKDLMVREFEFRERMFTSITDLVTLAIFLGISPLVKEGMTAYIRGDDKKDISPFRHFLKQTALIQRDATAWMLEIVPKTYKPDPSIFPNCLHKILFMVPVEEFWRVDGWPDEASRNLYVKATSEIPLLQDTICQLFVIGVSKSHPINGRDIIDLVEVLVKRAAGLHPLITDDFQVSIFLRGFCVMLLFITFAFKLVNCSSMSESLKTFRETIFCRLLYE